MDKDMSSRDQREQILSKNMSAVSSIDCNLERAFKPMPGAPPPIKEPIPWSAQCAILQTMFNVSSECNLGAAIMQHVDEVRKRVDLKDRDQNYKSCVELKHLTFGFRKIIMIEMSICKNSIRETRVEDELILARQHIVHFLDEIKLRCLRGKTSEEESSVLRPPKQSSEPMDLIIQCLFPPTSKEMKKEGIGKLTKGKDTEKALEKHTDKLFSVMLYDLKHMNEWTKASQNRTCSIYKDVLSELVGMLRALKPSIDEPQRERVEENIRQLIFNSLNMLDASTQLQQEQGRVAAKLSSLKSLSLSDTCSTQRRSSKQMSGQKTFIGGITEALGGALGGAVGAASSGHCALDSHAAGVLLGDEGVVTSSKHMPGQKAAVIAGGESSGASYRAGSGALSVGPAGSLVGGLLGGLTGPSGLLFGDRGEGRRGVVPAGKEMQYVATPFSPPIYLKGGGGGSGGSGEGSGGGGGDDGGGGEDDGGNRSGGSGRRNQREGNRCPEYCRRFLGACHSLTDAINDLCRVTSQINGMKNDCAEVLRNLQINEDMLYCGQPTTSLSYQESVHHLKLQKETILLLNDDQPVGRVVFWRTFRFVGAAVCKGMELAAQCGYYLMLRDADKEVASTGVVDTRNLKKLADQTRNSCHRIILLYPEEAKKEAEDLKVEIEKLLTMLSDAGRRAQNMKEDIEAAAATVVASAEEFHRSVDIPEEVINRNGWDISAVSIRLIDSIRKVAALTEDPSLVPVAANTSPESRKRQTDILTAARALKGKMADLVDELKVHEVTSDETMSWGNFDRFRREVVQAFERLLTEARRVGQDAGMLNAS